MKIQNEETKSGLTVDEAVSALTSKWDAPASKDQPKAAPEIEEEDTDLSEEEDEGEEAEVTDEDSDGEDTDQDDATPKPEPTEAPDDAVVKYKVGDEDHQITVGELKRLAGQEKALTQKGQQVAETRRQLEANAQYQAASLDRIYSKSKARWAQYAEIDFALAATQLDAETYTQLRADAQEAYQEIQFVESEVVGFVRQLEADKHTNLQAQARESIRILSDPKDGIPGFNRELYSEMRTYAVKSGLPQDTVDQLVDPAALRLIHKAMMHDKAGNTAATAKITRKPKVASRVTPSEGTKETTGGNASAKKAMARLHREKDTDSAVAALMARWAAAS
jgi:hypothetical protein